MQSKGWRKEGRRKRKGLAHAKQQKEDKEEEDEEKEENV